MLQSIEMGSLAHHAPPEREAFRYTHACISTGSEAKAKNYAERIARAFIQWKQCFNVDSLIVFELPI